jgi:hypothetical protein
MSRRAVARGAIAATSVFALGLGCGPTSVPLEISFPSTETFLVARSVHIRIYAIELRLARRRRREWARPRGRAALRRRRCLTL